MVRRIANFIRYNYFRDVFSNRNTSFLSNIFSIGLTTVIDELLC